MPETTPSYSEVRELKDKYDHSHVVTLDMFGSLKGIDNADFADNILKVLEPNSNYVRHVVVRFDYTCCDVRVVIYRRDRRRSHKIISSCKNRVKCQFNILERIRSTQFERNPYEKL